MEHYRLREGLLIIGIAFALNILVSAVSLIIYRFFPQYNTRIFAYILLALDCLCILLSIIGNHLCVSDDESPWYKKSVAMYYIAFFSSIGLLLYIIFGDAQTKAINITYAIVSMLMFISAMFLLASLRDTSRHLKCLPFIHFATGIVVIVYIFIIGGRFAIPYIDITNPEGKLAVDIIENLVASLDLLEMLFISLSCFVLKKNLSPVMAQSEN